MQNWDYQLPKTWQPTKDNEWEWFLVRKINYGELTGLKKAIIKQYFPKIKTRLDPGKRAMLEDYFKYGTD